MDYREFVSPEPLRHLVKLGWTLTVSRDGPKWVTHVATPDGCMEIIHRLEGRSKWGSDQPASFVAGMITRPAELRLSPGSRFAALRIWPWTWRALTGQSPGELIDRWASFELLPVTDSIEDLFAALLPLLPTSTPAPLLESLLASHSCREASARTGLSPRSLQRWFDRNVGVPPRTYLRLLRFSDAFADLPRSTGSLAEHALDHGFADQAHMARDFRSLSGAPARTARARGRGPFIDACNERS